MMRFQKRSLIPAPVEVVFAYCVSQSGFRQQFPFRVEWLNGPEIWGIGDEIDFRYRVNGIWLRHTARIVEFELNRCFVDEMTGGFYRAFRHRHEFEPSDTGTWVIDEVEFSLGFGSWLDRTLGGVTLQRVFARRHKALQDHFLGGL